MKHLKKETEIAQAVLEGIRNIAVDGCASASTNKNLAYKARDCFGTWENACEKAGVRPVRHFKPSKKYRSFIELREPKRDCKLYQDDMRCYGLNRMYCKFEECNFYTPSGGAGK